MDVLGRLKDRRFVQQCTHRRVAAALGSGPITLYAGFDATADSLHVGNLMPIMAMANLQRAGHRAIALIGGGTTRSATPAARAKCAS